MKRKHLLLYAIAGLFILAGLFSCNKKKKPVVEVLNDSIYKAEQQNGKFLLRHANNKVPDTIRLRYSIIDSLSVFQGDIIIGRQKKTTGKFLRVQGFFTSQNIWQDGTVPYDFDGSVLDADTAVVLQAMHEWTLKTGIHFEHHTSETDYVRLTYSDGYGSFIGRVGNMQPLYFPRDPDKGNLMHELGHCLGLWHEHCRPDRNNYIRVLENNVQDGFICQFAQPISDITTLNTPYDFNSIMHYPQNAFAKPGTNTIQMIKPDSRYHIGNRDSLSKGDIEGVKLLYSKSQNPGNNQNIKQPPYTCSPSNQS